ncbi:MAG TPA: 4-hydroxybenzoate octaprenyltransferase [Rhodospirillaceae bacterium]|nr:4-hydroxybenzoate octaprenyltransferase [Rhodospirillaceae bacterium]
MGVTPHTDIPCGDWIDRFLPAQLRPYARLMRLDRPIGTWLLLLPCWWSVTLASEGFPSITYLILFAFGAVLLRGAGCAINDIYDRRLDAAVERTRSRPLPKGDITIWLAGGFVVFLLLAGLAVLLQFNNFTVWLGVASLALVFTYPLAKRVTWWPQLVLGFTFNWGALMGWAAVHGELAAPAIILYVAGIFWTLGYDTIYAHQDKQDDAAIGIKSLALKLGNRSRPMIALFYVLFFFLLTMAGLAAKIGTAYYLILFLAELHAAWLLITWQPDEPASSLQKFRANRDLGLIVFLALLTGRFL